MICRECGSDMNVVDLDIFPDGSTLYFECPLCDTFCRRVCEGSGVVVVWDKGGLTDGNER